MCLIHAARGKVYSGRTTSIHCFLIRHSFYNFIYATRQSLRAGTISQRFQMQNWTYSWLKIEQTNIAFSNVATTYIWSGYRFYFGLSLIACSVKINHFQEVELLVLIWSNSPFLSIFDESDYGRTIFVMIILGGSISVKTSHLISRHFASLWEILVMVAGSYLPSVRLWVWILERVDWVDTNNVTPLNLSHTIFRSTYPFIMMLFHNTT